MSEQDNTGMNDEFDDPQAQPEGIDDEGMGEDVTDFDTPPESSDDTAEGEEAIIEEEEQFAEADESLLELYTQVTDQLGQQAYEEDGVVMAEDAFEGSHNIVGVGLGLAEDDGGLVGDPGAMALNVYVAEATSEDSVRAALVDSMGVSAASSDNLPMNVIVSGLIDADSHRFRIRPAPGGVSVGHFRITAGTLGCLARGKRSPRNRRVLIFHSQGSNPRL